MDPDQTLALAIAEMREALAEEDELETGAAVNALTHFGDLVTWLDGGGFLPARWANATRGA